MLIGRFGKFLENLIIIVMINREIYIKLYIKLYIYIKFPESEEIFKFLGTLKSKDRFILTTVYDWRLRYADLDTISIKISIISKVEWNFLVQQYAVSYPHFQDRLWHISLVHTDVHTFPDRKSPIVDFTISRGRPTLWKIHQVGAEVQNVPYDVLAYKLPFNIPSFETNTIFFAPRDFRNFEVFALRVFFSS